MHRRSAVSHSRCARSCGAGAAAAASCYTRSMVRGAWLPMLLGACEGKAPSPTDASSTLDSQPDAAKPTRLVAYVSGGADIAWYDVNKTTGALSSISSIPAFRTGANFLAFGGNHLYAVT